MTSPLVPPEEPLPVKALAEAVIARADRLGLLWRLRPATVVAPGADGSIRVVYDGDTESVRVVSLIGGVAAGARVMGLITPPAGNHIVGPLHINQDLTAAPSDTETGSYTATTTVYSTATTGGTYVDCAVVFAMPTSGVVSIWWQGQMVNSSAGDSCRLSPEVRAGGVVGSGAVVLAAADARSVLMVGTLSQRWSAFIPRFTGAPGARFNLRLLHRVSAGTGTFQNRDLFVVPLPA